MVIFGFVECLGVFGRTVSLLVRANAIFKVGCCDETTDVLGLTLLTYVVLSPSIAVTFLV